MVPLSLQSIRTSSSRRSSRTEQQRRNEVSQGFSNKCPSDPPPFLARLNVYLYGERGGAKDRWKDGGRNCQLSTWPDGQLFGREMRKFVHSEGGGEECYLFRGGKLWFWRKMRNWYGFRTNCMKYVQNIFNALPDISMNFFQTRESWIMNFFFSPRNISNSNNKMRYVSLFIVSNLALLFLSFNLN